MTSPTLLSAARDLKDYLYDKSCPGFVDLVCRLDGAIAAEEARLAKEGTVERYLLASRVCSLPRDRMDNPTLRIRDADYGEMAYLLPGDGHWSLYAERPLPPPKPEPSLEERLERIADCCDFSEEKTIREAAAELRRLKGGRA